MQANTSVRKTDLSATSRKIHGISVEAARNYPQKSSARNARRTAVTASGTALKILIYSVESPKAVPPRHALPFLVE
jgi:hypothetical protein